MQFKLEELAFQQHAIQSVVRIFDGSGKNNFDNSTNEGIRSNILTLSPEQINRNLKETFLRNGLDENTAKFDPAKQMDEINELLPFDVCVEMETGTGKTLVYLKTIYELHKQFGFTKFIILVPSVAIREGVLSTLQTFEKQLEDIYGFTPNYFEYNSKRIHEVARFAEEQHPQIMITTVAAIRGEKAIINREQREDLFDNLAFIELLAKTQPVVVMDEPQEGMDAEESKKAIDNLKPLCRLRYSATHIKDKTFNLVYRLTPYASYKQNLVKKIEVLTVVEKNDEATLKIELTNAKNERGVFKARLKAWKKNAAGEIAGFKETNWLKLEDNLADKTGNSIYGDYTIENIRKEIGEPWRVRFSNGVEIFQKEASGSFQAVWALQMEFLIRRHFEKAAELNPKGIKCLSLIFINRVANYIGDDPVIKNLFVEKYRELYPKFHGGAIPADEQIEQAQGSYFARTGGDEFSDTEGGLSEQKRIYDLILKGKEELLSLDNPVQFIFSHSALGVGWDNPNVFNIATLSTTYSEIKKRQEIGRGLRICVNQKGERVYDAEDITASERINQLTVIPNETYETFAQQYQEEIKEIYGTTDAGAGLTHSDKGKSKSEVEFKRSQKQSVNEALKRFWDALARKTDYTVAFDEEAICSQAVEEIKKIKIQQTEILAVLQSIDEMTEEGFTATYHGDSSRKVAARFSSLDLIEELSEDTHLSYPAILRIVGEIAEDDETLKHWIKNPPLFVQRAASIIKDIELRDMLRGLNYHLTDETIPFDFEDYVDEVADQDKNLAYTPSCGVYDIQKIDSAVEKSFAETADKDNQIVCILKLPKAYRIPTPIGFYEPDFGIVIKRREIGEGSDEQYHFVVETKGTAKLDDMKSLKESESYKMKCALKHFTALGVKLELKGEDIYKAPVKEYSEFKKQAFSQ